MTHTYDHCSVTNNTTITPFLHQQKASDSIEIMAAAASSAAVIGSTGLVGSNILSTLLETAVLKPIHTISRRAPKAASPNLNAIIETDSATWAQSLSTIAPTPLAVFSALGTTRALAGGIENQWKIDHDLNIELAKAAKAAGVETFVFISSAGTRGFLSSFSPYSKMKIGVEDTVKDLDFEHGIILRPGMILGERGEGRAVERVAQNAVRALNGVGLQDALGQEALVIGRAAVRAAQLVQEGKAPSKFWVLEASDILRLGRTEWTDATPAQQ